MTSITDDQYKNDLRCLKNNGRIKKPIFAYTLCGMKKIFLYKKFSGKNRDHAEECQTFGFGKVRCIALPTLIL